MLALIGSVGAVLLASAASFVAGVLVGRRNRKLVETAVTDVKKVLPGV